MKRVIPGQAGGKARAEILPPEKRSEIAQKAALARWGAKTPQATHRGNFKEEFGVDVECYVLDDPGKTAVLSQTGMAQALGLGSGGRAFPRFLTSNAMRESVGAELAAKIENPLVFQWGGGGAGAPPTSGYGFDATLLIDVCNAITTAEASGALKSVRYEKVVQQAHIIVGASAKSGIKGLVYALAGYSPSAEEVIAAFKLYVQEEARKYEPEFPNELYMQWHRLYEIPIPVRGKPWQFKHLTEKHIYYPLAKSNGKVLDLLRALKARGGDRQKKLFQFLNILGARALRMHIGRVLEMTEDSPDQETYERKILVRFGRQQELDLITPGSSTASGRPSEQSPGAAQP
jgi:hypothetical protein